MERALAERGNSKQVASRCVAQCRSASGSRQNWPTSGIDGSPFMVAQLRKLKSMFGAVAQPHEGVAPQGNSETVQRVAEEEETAQPKLANQAPAQLESDSALKPNNTGMPDNLKAGIESLSGISLDSVRVHYNSSHPAQLNALAYAQGTDIHVAPGQERHLPHEAWHVVQQAQGRVQPTMQLREGVPMNDDVALEHEADVLGKRAIQTVGAD